MKNEVKIPMRVVKKEYKCPECENYMEHNGRVFMVNPPIYEHICKNCENVERLREQYPKIEAIENEDNYNYLKVAEILEKYLPPDGVGTEREKLRMNLYRELLDI